MLHFFITLVKLHFWISRNRGVTPHLSAFKEFVKIKFRTVKYLPMKNSIELYFRLDGSRILNYINTSSGELGISLNLLKKGVVA